MARLARFIPFEGASVLHISDLHIPKGACRAGVISHRPWQQLWDKRLAGRQLVEVADLCFVTGDLAESSPDTKIYDTLKVSLDKLFPADGSGLRELQRVGATSGNGVEQSAPASRRWLVVPGNHDRRKLGNFFLDNSSFERAFGEWSQAWCSISCGLIVVPLDSNPDESAGRQISWALPLARGVVGKELTRLDEALRDVEARVLVEFRRLVDSLAPTELARYVKCLAGAFRADQLQAMRSIRREKGQSDYDLRPVRAELARVVAKLLMARAVRCVLLHHHPVGIANTENLGVTHQDAYLTLTDSGEFLKAAREHGISLVCHGHKHMPHRMKLGVPGMDQGVGVIGAGSSTARGAHSHTSCNLIEISDWGGVSVRLVRPGAESWEESDNAIEIRSWLDVKACLGREALELSDVSAHTSSTFVHIQPNGDAVIQRVFEGVKFKQSAVCEDGYFRFPVHVQTSGHLRTPVISVAIESNPGAAYLTTRGTEPDHDCSPHEWSGCVSFDLTSVEDVRLRITWTFNGYCAFPTNLWQVVCSYGPGDSVTREHYSQVCSIPITDRLVISLRSEEPQFGEPRPVQENADGRSEGPELSSVRVLTGPSLREINVVAPSPVWGSSYGLSWKWRHLAGDVGELAQRLKSNPLVRATDEHGNWQGPAQVREALVGALNEACDAEGFEGALFAINAASFPVTLRQVAWSSRVGSAGVSSVQLPFGCGIAGRAAWLGEAVHWQRAKEDESQMPEGLAPRIYLPVGGRVSHRELLAVPFRVKGLRVAVLSVGVPSDAVASQRLTEKQMGKFRTLALTLENILRDL